MDQSQITGVRLQHQPSLRDNLSINSCRCTLKKAAVLVYHLGGGEALPLSQLKHCCFLYGNYNRSLTRETYDNESYCELLH